MGRRNPDRSRKQERKRKPMPHRVYGVCTAKGSAFTTWDAAMAVVANTPDAVRAYRGDCCGYYHITRYTEDEWAQRVAELVGPRVLEETDDRREQEAGAGDDGQAPVQRSGEARLTPSPATLARRLSPRRNPEVER